ncbi:Kiwa anti-phage protein KwaB-like domain-containing protein [Lactobacillus johnsonii]|uniref:Kiwa anti-phage protein KwaB-like domain-containing protein n=1 Tax=Lactobacillus johnsonii TaxID=33959 RepID=UPI001FB424E4|nr:Kiwa anti-phage protein KwaB-like domain-containing protein [Lactobacillus johnsonii]UOC06920.1 DUF4868 domain-containing protein [Lactobacillus johnsonii]
MNFDLTKAKEVFKKAKKVVHNENTDITLFLLWKPSNHKEMLFSKAEIGKEEKDSFIKRFDGNYNENDTYCSYSVILEKTSKKICIEKNNFYPLMEKYIFALDTNVSDKDKQYNEDLTIVVNHLNYVKGYCADFFDRSSQQHVYLFGTTTSFNSMTKQKALGMVGNVSTTGIKKLGEEDKILGFKPNTTCFILNDYCIINSKHDFENTFGLLEEYKKSANKVIDAMNKRADFFQNISQMKSDLKAKPIYARSLVKFAKHANRINNLTSHLKEIEKVVKSDNFKNNYDKIQLNSKGIVYTTDSMEQFLSLLNEKPVSSLITGDEFLADRDE